MLLLVGTLLERVPGFPRELQPTLKAIWITTAEQFVAATAAVGGAKKMAVYLQSSPDEVVKALSAAEQCLTPETRDALRSKADTEGFGLGAVLPPDDQ